MNGGKRGIRKVVRWLGGATLADVVTWGLACAMILYIALVKLGCMSIGGLHEEY